MSKILYMLKKKKMLIIIIAVLLVCSIAIAVGVYAQITNQGVKTIEKGNEGKDYESLKNSFEDIFDNKLHKEDTENPDINYEGLVYTRYDIEEEQSGKYSISAKIPWINGDSEVIAKINDEILHVFGAEVLTIQNEAKSYVTYNLSYTAYINNNIVSLVIMCKYKNGINPQRKIIQCYNYDLENDKLLNIEDVINYKNLNKEEMQNKIDNEIKNVNTQIKSIGEQGYNIYVRDEQSRIYKVENTQNFFLGQNNYLYLVYAYGNNNYTSEMDLVIY